AWINVVHQILQFQKPIQSKIHEGRIGYATAYELLQKPKDKWESIIALVEEKRLKAITAAEKEEDAFLKGEKKSIESEQKEADKLNKEAERKTAVDTAQATAEAAAEAVKAATDLAAAAYTKKATA